MEAIRSLYKWGWWQTLLALLVAFPVYLTGVYTINYVFLASSVEYRCQVPECESSSLPAEVWSSWALPEDSRCDRWTHNATTATCSEDAFSHAETESCDEFVYANKKSMYSEFNLACAEWKRSLVGTIHNIGMLVSMPLMGYVSDRWGRRCAVVLSGVGVGLVGVGKSLAGSYAGYLVAELLEAIIGSSVYPAAFVLIIEWLSVDQRVLASLILGVPLSLGAMSLALVHYFSDNWRTCAQIAYAPSLLIILYPWLLPESVKWLMTNGRKKEATEVLKAAARANKLQAEEGSEEFEKILAEFEPETMEKDGETENLMTAFVKYPVLRQRLLICCIWWSSAVFVFYGLAVNAPSLYGSLHVNLGISALAELPALVLNTVLLDRVGRRMLLRSALLLTAVSLVALACCKVVIPTGGLVGVLLFLLGKVGATMSLNALYVYTAELFPTAARHRLLAACSMSGRLGAILAPLTPLLAEYQWWIPAAIFGTVPLISASLLRFVPDTLQQQLPNTFADLQPSKKHQKEMEVNTCRGTGIENAVVDEHNVDSVV